MNLEETENGVCADSRIRILHRFCIFHDWVLCTVTQMSENRRQWWRNCFVRPGMFFAVILFEMLDTFLFAGKLTEN